MTKDQLRQRVIAAYPSAKWRLKVEAMTDLQVFAIFKKLLANGKV